MRTSAAESRCGQASGGRPRSERFSVSERTSHLVDGSERNRYLLNLEAAELGLRLLIA